MNIKNMWEFILDFFGNHVFSTTQADNAPLRMAVTAAAGTPTYALVNGSAAGELKVDMDSTNEVQNVCAYQSDLLQFAASTLGRILFRIKMNQSAINAATTFSFGLTSARNSTLASITSRILFKLLGSGSTTNVVIDTSDGTTTNTGVATGKTLVNAYKNFEIDFSNGLSDVRFYIDGVRVAESTTFSVAAISGSLQIFLQLQKTAATAADGYTIDYVKVEGRRMAI